MICSYKHKNLKALHVKGKSKGLPPRWVAKLKKTLDRLHIATNIKELNYHGTRLHKLDHWQADLWSVDISGNWRVTFRWLAGEVYDVDFRDTH